MTQEAGLGYSPPPRRRPLFKAPVGRAPFSSVCRLDVLHTISFRGRKFEGKRGKQERAEPVTAGHLLLAAALPGRAQPPFPRRGGPGPASRGLQAAAHPEEEEGEEQQPGAGSLRGGVGAGGSRGCPAPEGFTYCAEEGKEGGKQKQNKPGKTPTELRQRSSGDGSLP